MGYVYHRFTRLHNASIYRNSVLHKRDRKFVQATRLRRLFRSYPDVLTNGIKRIPNYRFQLETCNHAGRVSHNLRPQQSFRDLIAVAGPRNLRNVIEDLQEKCTNSQDESVKRSYQLLAQRWEKA